MKKRNSTEPVQLRDPLNEQHKGRKKLISCIALVLGVAIIPLMYSGIYLASVWDTYGRLDTLPVAVVNHDQGAQINGEERNLGQELIDKMEESKDLDWVMTDEADAKAGLETENRYYAVIDIPSDFSQNVATAEDVDKVPATITYSANEKRNYIASTIMKSAAQSLQKELRASVTEQITGNLVQQLNSVPSQMETISEGFTTLGDGTGALRSGMDILLQGSQTITTNLETLDNGLEQAKDGSEQLNQALTQLPTLMQGIEQLNQGASDLSAGLNQAAQGASTLNDGAANLTDLTNGIQSLSQGSNQVSIGAQQYVSLTNGIQQALMTNGYDGAKTVQALAQQLQSASGSQADSLKAMIGIIGGNSTVIQNLTDQYNAIKDNPAYAQQAAQLQALIGMLQQDMNKGSASAASQYAAAGAQLVNGTSQLNQGAEQLAASTGKIGELQSGISSLNTALSQLNDGGKQVADGTATLSSSSSQLTQLQQGVGSLNSALGQLSGGASQLYQGSSELTNGVSSAQDGVVQLDDGVASAKEELDGAISETSEKLKATDGLETYTANGVSVQAEPYEAVPNYGTAFAPYFISVSLWTGGLSILMSIYLEPNRRMKRLSVDSHSRVIRMFAFLGIGVLQAVLLGIVGQFGLGLPINHVFGFYSAVILASVTFVAIIQFLMMYLGDIGKILSMALMVLQLTSTGGTFPIETSGAFFEVLNKIMPMTYSVNLLKEVISGGDAGIIWYNVGILFAFFAVFTAVTLGLSIYQNKKDKKKKEIEHIDIDTDVTEMTV